ncbi:hypothetical protein SAMN05421684_1526 [Asanoa ishikariensis]|uniref:Uncharacterized protein n=1 Tax=Asanoa ishikariensis TaxID=137265 RepID=A0A1H3MQ19_9ACTN|nr:hypothetical protein [Asanoa ishikariensis]SDY78275.1 hypothetical protein SAMN05421684_1526 [Asanoa ishikariensis]
MGTDGTAATGVIADPAPGEGVETLPIVPSTGPNPAPSQTGGVVGTSERQITTPGVPIITGLDTVAGPETAVGNALSGVSTGNGAAGTLTSPVSNGATGTLIEPAPQVGDGESPAGTEPVSVERLPTRLSLNKAKHAAAAQNGIFRLGDLVHSDARPTPESAHMLGVCAWGTALALAGVGVGIRGLAAIIGGIAPGWYQPALIAVGLIGVLLTVGAFVTIQRRYTPWLMLAFATIPLAVSIALTIIAL